MHVFVLTALHKYLSLAVGSGGCRRGADIAREGSAASYTHHLCVVADPAVVARRPAMRFAPKSGEHTWPTYTHTIPDKAFDYKPVLILAQKCMHGARNDHALSKGSQAAKCRTVHKRSSASVTCKTTPAPDLGESGGCASST